MRAKTYSLASRVPFWFALNLLIAGAIIATSVHAGLKRFMLDEAKVDLNNRIEAMTFALQKSGALERFKPQLENEWQSRGGELVYVRVLDSQGHEMVSSSTIKKEHLTDLFVNESPTKKPIVRELRGKSYLIYTTHLTTEDPQLNKATFEFAADMTQHQKLLARYYRLFWLVFLCGAIVSVMWSWYIIRSAFSPLQNVIDRIRRWQTALHQRRLPSDGLPQELVVLIETFNRMLEKIDDAFDRLSRFSADIAHELKAPIMNITSSTEIKLSRTRTIDEYRDALHSNLEEMRRIAEIVESLLFVARSESPDQYLKIENLNLRETVEKLVEFYQGLADENNVRLVIDIRDDLQLFGERTLLERAISNLLSNAIKYSPPEGRVTISARQTVDKLMLTISDQGEGISPNDLPFVFDRFYRGHAEQAKGPTPGHGLGLTIVQSIMRLHKGQATISSQAKSGTSVSLEFPLEIQRKFRSGTSVVKHTAHFGA